MLGTDVPMATNSQILSVVRRALGYIDRRLMDHGERVAYIACAILDGAGELGVDRDKLLILSLLHDVGAYKTEEIDNMVAFETGDVLAHAVYGYVFLRNTTALGDYAEAILYHHTNYDRLQGMATPAIAAAELIFLADRVDILLATTRSADSLSAIRRLSGAAFSPGLVEAFFAAEARQGISAHILDESYRRRIGARIDAIRLPQAQVDEYLRMLVYSIDFRSPFTVTHTANTTAISSALAELFHLSGEERQTLLQGAFLHDIGKIAIPYSILENPGKLDPDQMAQMRAHVTVSEEILSGIVPEEICQIAARHHEKLNGAGYPKGLREPELTLPQRIVAVADILSALISRRSYKEPFPKEKTLSILVGMRDAGELCPAVCNMVVDHYDSILNTVHLVDDPVIQLYEKIKNEYAEFYGALRAFDGQAAT